MSDVHSLPTMSDDTFTKPTNRNNGFFFGGAFIPNMDVEFCNLATKETLNLILHFSSLSTTLANNFTPPNALKPAPGVCLLHIFHHASIFEAEHRADNIL
jgi:hypothetical protein